MAQINNGISKVEFAPIAADGGAGTAFFTLGLTKEDSFQWNFEDDEVLEFPVEEQDTPITLPGKKGKKGFTFTVENPDEDTFVKAFGGTVTGTGATAVFKFPTVAPTIELTAKVSPKIGTGFLMPRVLLAAKLTPEMGRNSLLGVEVTCTVLQPTKTAEPIISTFRV